MPMPPPTHRVARPTARRRWCSTQITEPPRYPARPQAGRPPSRQRLRARPLRPARQPRLAGGRHSCHHEALPKLRTGERPFRGERPLDHVHAAVSKRRRDSLLGQTTRVSGEERRCRQGVQPRVVLAADEVQRAAVEPRDQERALVGESAVDVGGGESGRPGANREARSPRVLPLHREQPLGHRHGIARRRPREELRAQPLPDQPER